MTSLNFFVIKRLSHIFKTEYVTASSLSLLNSANLHFSLLPNFITDEEEKILLSEIEPRFRRTRYQSNHWDDAITNYRETEIKDWGELSKPVIFKIRALFPPESVHLNEVHILDLHAEGAVLPHVDSTRFCGSVIIGLSLLSSSIMRMFPENSDPSSQYISALLPQRSVYIMKDEIRNSFKHEILGSDESFFNGKAIERSRRVSAVFRIKPD